MKIVSMTYAKITILSLLVFSCTNKELVTEQLRDSCAHEAEQLVTQVLVFEQPAESGSGVTLLKPGRFIYRCEKHGEWTAIMYPDSGKKVNCNYRKGKHRCAVAWVQGEISTKTFD